jgi:hypothetical protein
MTCYLLMSFPTSLCVCSAASCCMSGRAWAYLCRVNATDEWPARSDTTLEWTPARSRSVMWGVTKAVDRDLGHLGFSHKRRKGLSDIARSLRGTIITGEDETLVPKSWSGAQALLLLAHLVSVEVIEGELWERQNASAVLCLWCFKHQSALRLFQRADD